MNKLTTFSRVLIAIVLVAIAFFTIKHFLPQFSKKGEDTTQTDSSTKGENQPETKTDDNRSTSDAPKNRPSFDYTPKEPVGGKLKGVVELGASGFNSFIVRIDAQKNWKLEKADYGASLIYEKMASDEDVKSGLKNYIAGMLNYGVNPKDIHFVISSGAQKVDATKKIITHLKTMGYVVNLVTAEQEGKLALKCALPADYQNDAFVADIGSGNTKISWMTGANVTSKESYGAKYFQNNTPDATVYEDVKAKVSLVPSSNRKVCFIIGGVPFSLAKPIRNGKERFTILNAPETYKDNDAKIKSGVNIYKALADGSNCQQFVFDWDSNFTIGFLLNM